MLAWFCRLFGRKRSEPTRIIIDDGGFFVSSADRSFRVTWRSVNRVLAYKRDLLTTDEVIVAFRQRETPDHVLEVSEEWDGFRDLFEPMERELGVNADWYLTTIGRPFATDFQVVYEREPGPSTTHDAAG